MSTLHEYIEQLITQSSIFTNVIDDGLVDILFRMYNKLSIECRDLTKRFDRHDCIRQYRRQST
jgi:predicted Mrr-cat superfamily restriction endonuclease